MLFISIQIMARKRLYRARITLKNQKEFTRNVYASSLEEAFYRINSLFPNVVHISIH